MCRFIFRPLAAFAALALAVILPSCGGGNDVQNLENNVQTIAGRIDSTVSRSPEAVKSFSMKLSDKAVDFSAEIAPDIFDLKLLEPSLAEFAVAAYAHVTGSDGKRDAAVTDMINNMSKAGRPLQMVLSQGSSKFEQTLDGSRLKTLYKQSLTDLNRTTAASNAAQLTGSWAEKVFRTDGATDFECVYSTNRIVITVTYTSAAASPLKDVTNPTPALKGMLADAAEAHYSKYGELRPAVTALMKDLGVKELRLTYKYSDGKPAPSVRLEWGSDL